MAVRLDKDLRATIDKIVASYNRKINKYKRMGLKTPEKTSYQNIIKLPTRKSIKSELKRLQSLNLKSVDNIVYKGELTTIYEKETFEKRLRLSKRKIKTRIKNLVNTEYKIYGNKTGYTMGDRALFLNLENRLKNGQIKNDKLISNLRKLERLNQTPFDVYVKMDSKEKESFISLFNRIENPYINKKLKDNYLESLTDLGSSYGYDSKKLAEIEEKLKTLSNEDFEKMFTEDIGIRKVLSYYDILKINLGTESNYMENKEAVFNLYDNIYDNINQIVESYQQ